MTPFLNGVARAIAETFTLDGPVIEIGSYQVPGQERINNLRSLFLGREYIGVDIRPGPGVDRVADVEDLPFADGFAGTIIAMSTFEHVRHFWRGFDEVRRVLRSDGALLVSCPFHFYIHNHPCDYWRFTPEALGVLLEEYPSRLVGWHGAEDRPENVWALAFREDHPPISPEQFDRYRALLERHAKQPLRRRRRWRYQIFDWIDRRGLCAPILERERSQSRLFNNTPEPALASFSGATPV